MKRLVINTVALFVIISGATILNISQSSIANAQNVTTSATCECKDGSKASRCSGDACKCTDGNCNSCNYRLLGLIKCSP